MFFYYVIKPSMRKSVLLILSLIFWSTQSFLTIGLLLLCFLFDIIYFKYQSHVDLSFNGAHFILRALSYIFVVICYYYLPAPNYLVNSSVWGAVDLEYRTIPSGLLILCLQSIRNLNLSETPKGKEFNVLNWVNSQILFTQFFCGPVNNFNFIQSQLEKKIRFDPKKFIVGFKLLFWALLKKLVIADRLEGFVINYSTGNFIFGSSGDIIFSVFIPFLYISFLVGAYISMGRAVAAFFGIDSLRNIDIYAYLTGIGNFWSRWLITIKQTFDEVFVASNHNKLISYTFVIVLNCLIFSNSYFFILVLPVGAFFIFLDFKCQDKGYFNNFFMSGFVKTLSFCILSLFWSLMLFNSQNTFELNGNSNFLLYFKNSDFLIFILILGVVIFHILKRRISLIAFKEEKEFEDISLVGIVFLGYFVLMFGVF